MKILLKIAGMGLALGLLGAVVAGFFVLYQYGRDLPDVNQMADYQPPVTTRAYTADGSLLVEFARQNRLFVPISAVPEDVVDAFLAAEDKNFYQHSGIDFTGILRAVVINLTNIGSNRRLVGASTITQQVAKNFLLSGEVTYARKIKEAILAYRIERAFTKVEILELYLNDNYFGQGAYGVAAAALRYFEKPLNELTLSEIAYLAALPKGPNNYHPVRNYDAATSRRNWVIGRMQDEGFIDAEEADAARAEPLVARIGGKAERFEAAYFTEEIRRYLYNEYGADELYEGGLSVRTTLDPRLQEIAERSISAGLVAYDRRHGWRGPLRRVDVENWSVAIEDIPDGRGKRSWRVAVVLELTEDSAVIGLRGENIGVIPMSELTWARRWKKDQKTGGRPKTPGDVLAPGDVILVERLPSDDGDRAAFALRQVPDIEGGLVAMDPHTGRVLALVGGFDYSASEFNRATQASRQPGSAFKPFVYAAALDSGFTPSDLVLDAPFVIEQGFGLGKWKPANYSNKFYGPSTLRLGIEKSRNLMTVRLAQDIGMQQVADYAHRFGISEDMPPNLAMALGAGETTLMQLTAAYSMLVNGGKRVEPTLIDRIQDRRGKSIYLHDRRPCDLCRTDAWEGQEEPIIPDQREVVLNAGTAYQVVSMLQGVVERGTGVRIRSVGKPLAGKTGTTNESMDTWFMGFSPDLAVGVFAGFDSPRTLGKRETGSSVAAPIFRDFMKDALAGQPAIPFRIPPGIRLVRVNPTTGLLATAQDRRVILEAFKPGTEPGGQREVLDGSDSVVQTGTGPQTGTGGLY